MMVCAMGVYAVFREIAIVAVFRLKLCCTEDRWLGLQASAQPTGMDDLLIGLLAGARSKRRHLCVCWAEGPRTAALGRCVTRLLCGHPPF